MESQKDINIVANVGGALTHFNNVSEGGGALQPYDTTPVGGPPSADVDEDVRERITYTVATLVMGADQTARDAFLAKFAAGKFFDAVAGAPAGTNQMKITGPNQARAAGRRFTIFDPTSSTDKGGNMVLTFTLNETGATPAV
jgi:hypothetical protein